MLQFLTNEGWQRWNTEAITSVPIGLLVCWCFVVWLFFKCLLFESFSLIHPGVLLNSLHCQDWPQRHLTAFYTCTIQLWSRLYSEEATYWRPRSPFLHISHVFLISFFLSIPAISGKRRSFFFWVSLPFRQLPKCHGVSPLLLLQLWKGKLVFPFRK